MSKIFLKYTFNVLIIIIIIIKSGQVCNAGRRRDTPYIYTASPKTPAIQNLPIENLKRKRKQCVEDEKDASGLGQ